MYAFLIFFLLFICCVLSKRERLKKSGYNKHHKSIILVLFFISLCYSVDAFQGNCALVTYPHINEFNRFYLFFTTDFFRCCLSIFSSFFSFYNFLRLPLYFFLYFDFIFYSFCIFLWSFVSTCSHRCSINAAVAATTLVKLKTSEWMQSYEGIICILSNF